MLSKITFIDEQFDAIHHMVWDNRRLTVLQIAKSMEISSHSVHIVLTEVSRMSKMGHKNADSRVEAKERGNNLFTCLHMKMSPNFLVRRLFRIGKS